MARLRSFLSHADVVSWVKYVFACFIVLAVFACGGGGCSGCAQCGLTPIPGGFPVSQPRIANSGQIRLTEGGIQFIEDNAPAIVEMVNGGPLDFDVPRSEVDAPIGTATVCPSPPCTIHMQIHSLELTPTSPNRLHAVIRAIVTGTVPVQYLGTNNIIIDTHAGSRPYVAVQTDITFANEPRSPRTGFTRIDVGAISLVDGQGIENEDITLRGGISFILNLFKTQLIRMLTDQISGLSNGLVGDNLCTKAGETGCPTGTVADGRGPDAICRFSAGGACVPILLGMDGQGDMGNAFLGGFSPGTHAPIQLVLASGGDGSAINSGMSLYMTGGFLSYDRAFTRTPGHNPCVPQLPQPDAPDVARVMSFQGNVIPGTSTPVHLGIGIAEDYLNYAGYGMFDSGMLCLGIGTRLSQQLSTGLFSALVPTLRQLTYPAGSSPISIAVRPQLPPTFAVGTAADDALLTITLPQAQMDFYVWSQERYIRFMTYQTDLVIGMNLSVAGGQIVPEIVAVTPTNSSVLNSEILTERPEALAMTIETVITSFAGMLTSSISPIDLPPIDVNGDGRPDIQINVPEGGVRGVSDAGERFLGIFANLAMAPRSPLTFPIDTTLEVSDLVVNPETMGQDTFGQNGRNSVWLHFGAEGPEGVDYEYSYRIDGALWSPWTRERRIQIDDALLLMQAHHYIEARARIAGRLETADATPARAELLIDVLAPDVTLEASERGLGVHVIADDIVTAADALEMRWRIVDGGWSSWGPVTDLDADPSLVQVEVRDEAGNVGRSSAPLIRGIPNPAGGGSCDCRAAVGSGSSSGAPLGLLSTLFVLGGFFLRRSRRATKEARRERRPFDGAALVLALVVASSLVVTGCDCGGGGGGGDDASVGTDAPPVACGGAVCEAASPPGVTRGSMCCESTSMCVDYDLATICGAGFTCALANLTIDGSCNVTCSSCEALPPLATGLLATDLDLVVASADAYLSGYAPGVPGGASYGDLVFGTLGAGSSDVAWEIVDGVPADGRITGAIDGWRGGNSTPGDDVGRWTSMARSADGTFYIAYYDVTNTALKIAIGTPGAWTSHTVDATGDAGRYTSIVLTSSGAPAIAYQRIELADDGSGRVHSAVRVATAASATPSSTADWTSTEVSGSNGACRPQFCGEGQVCLESGTCATPTTDCSDACGSDAACVSGACQAKLATAFVEDLPPTRGLYAQLATTSAGLALTFYDRAEGNLYGAAFDGSSWGAPFLIDGYGRTGGTGDSGIGSSLFVDGSGTWHVTYVDGTDEGLRYAQVTGGSVTVRELVDDGTTDGTTPHTDGRHLVGDDSSVVVTTGGEVRVAYQDATSHTVMIARRSGTSWSQSVLDAEDHTGFWVEQALSDDGSRVATWWRRQMARSTVNGVRVLSAD